MAKAWVSCSEIQRDGLRISNTSLDIYFVQVRPQDTSKDSSTLVQEQEREIVRFASELQSVDRGPIVISSRSLVLVPGCAWCVICSSSGCGPVCRA
jgi:hypothetical protein